MIKEKEEILEVLIKFGKNFQEIYGLIKAIRDDHIKLQQQLDNLQRELFLQQKTNQNNEIITQKIIKDVNTHNTNNEIITKIANESQKLQQKNLTLQTKIEKLQNEFSVQKKEYETQNNTVQTGNIPEIKKIDTNEIRKKLQEAINEKENKKNSKSIINAVEVTKNLVTCNASKILDFIKKVHNEECDVIRNIISQSIATKSNFFIDAEGIFGIYNPDNSTNVIHISPKCHKININEEQYIKTVANNCTIYNINDDGQMSQKQSKLPICKHCCKQLYNTNIDHLTMEDFINDILSGTCC